jgi:hypothetical protein
VERYEDFRLQIADLEPLSACGFALAVHCKREAASGSTNFRLQISDLSVPAEICHLKSEIQEERHHAP